MQVSGLLPFVLLPVAGVASKDVCDALQALVLAGSFDGSVVCPAGMNVLHYIVMQPALLRERRNNMLRLLELALKLSPDVNGQVRTQLATNADALPLSQPARLIFAPNRPVPACMRHNLLRRLWRLADVSSMHAGSQCGHHATRV